VDTVAALAVESPSPHSSVNVMCGYTPYAFLAKVDAWGVAELAS